MVEKAPIYKAPNGAKVIQHVGSIYGDTLLDDITVPSQNGRVVQPGRCVKGDVGNATDIQINLSSSTTDAIWIGEIYQKVVFFADSSQTHNYILNIESSASAPARVYYRGTDGVMACRVLGVTKSISDTVNLDEWNTFEFWFSNTEAIVVINSGTPEVIGTHTTTANYNFHSFNNTLLAYKSNYTPAKVSEYLVRNVTLGIDLIHWVFDEGNGDTIHSIVDNGLGTNDVTGTIMNRQSDTWVEDGTISSSYVNDNGYTDNLGIIVPAALNSSTLDALGNTLEYSGKTSYTPKIVNQPCLTSDGTQTLSFTNLTGINIVSYEGTSIASKSGNTITLTPGTIYNLILDDGTLLPLQESDGRTAYAIGGTAGNATIINYLATNWTDNTQDSYARNALLGYNNMSSSGKLFTDFTNDLGGVDYASGSALTLSHDVINGLLRLENSDVNSYLYLKPNSSIASSGPSRWVFKIKFTTGRGNGSFKLLAANTSSYAITLNYTDGVWMEFDINPPFTYINTTQWRIEPVGGMLVGDVIEMDYWYIANIGKVSVKTSNVYEDALGNIASHPNPGSRKLLEGIDLKLNPNNAPALVQAGITDTTIIGSEYGKNNNIINGENISRDIIVYDNPPDFPRNYWDEFSFKGGLVYPNTSGTYTKMATNFINGSDWSFSGWFIFSSISGVRLIGSSFGSSFVFLTNASILRVNQAGASDLSFSVSIPLDTKVHIGISVIGLQTKVYVNSVESSTGALTATDSAQNSFDRFGATNSGVAQQINGVQSETAFWNTGLSQDEFKYLFNKGRGRYSNKIKEGNLVHWWDFNSLKTPTTVEDLKGINTLTLKSFPTEKIVNF